MDFNKTQFIRSCAKPSDFPSDSMKRVVFVGRSNVGKSSTINQVVGKKGFARVSSAPGKTVFVNLFLVDGQAWLVDLPGYGYSKTSKTERARYSELIDQYFQYDMESISRLYHIVDIRHKPTEDDKLMCQWARSYNLPITVVANKLDKIKRSQVDECISLIKTTLLLDENTPVIPFSAEKGDGVLALRDDIVKACI